MKRRMTSGGKKKVISQLFYVGKFAEYFREEEAVRLMEIGKLRL